VAFPQVAATNSGNSGANATSHVINMPAGVAVGDLVIVGFCSDQDSTFSVSSGTGWTQIFERETGSTIRIAAYYKVADGSGDNLTIDTSAAQGTAHVSYRITGHDSGTAPEDPAVPGLDSSAAPNAPSLNPTNWNVEDTLWIVFYGWNGDISNSTYPANYSSNQVTNRWANVDGVGVAMATRELAAASDDPGAAALSGGTIWVANTFAVRPAATPAPTVTSIDPASGTTAGGTSVTITGTDFVDTPTVTFGGDAATNVAFTNSTTITCDTPAHAAGAVDVIVTNPDAQADTLTDGYEYVTPAASSASPSYIHQYRFRY
jgi:hypothetical protein